MEARSLASLNYLAANPPQYPVNPTEQRQDPLTLYISRVPGTRDVILSPFKPQLKNVTVEDVANSLYYIHFDTSRPNLTGPPPAGHDGFHRSSDEDSSGRRDIPRKPVPGSDRTPTPDGPRVELLNVDLPTDHQFLDSKPPVDWFGETHPALRTTPMTLPAGDSGMGLADPNPHPYPPSHSTSRPDQSHLSTLQTQIPSRKPLGSSPTSATSGKALPPPPKEAEPFSSSERPYSQQSYYERHERPDYDRPYRERPWSQTYSQPPYQPHEHQDTLFPPPPPHHGHFPPASASTQDIPQHPPPYTAHPPTQAAPIARPIRTPSPQKPRDTFALSLIRRDPGSGTQWNVGRIVSQHFDPNTASPGEDGAPPARPSIDVQLETSGYAKFRNQLTRRSLDVTAPEVVAEDQHSDTGLFCRQVVMSYSRSWSSTLKQKLGRLDKQRMSHIRNISNVSVNSTSSQSAGQPESSLIIGQPAPGTKPRGYIFNSPWDGRCEFRTGNGGRSVRCHHILHEGQNANFNPLVAEQQHNENSPPDAATAVVSELRFNLPNSELFGGDENKGGAQKLGNFRKFWKRDDGDFDDDDDDEVSPFDVNVGSERAGGGNRGKRAKLGKLIVYHDGLKMLDLVVAANMGVWWGAWEKSF